MSGTYLHRAPRPDPHICGLPRRGSDDGPRVGDVWRCDDCGQPWRFCDVKQGRRRWKRYKPSKLWWWRHAD